MLARKLSVLVFGAGSHRSISTTRTVWQFCTEAEAQTAAATATVTVTETYPGLEHGHSCSGLSTVTGTVDNCDSEHEVRESPPKLLRAYLRSQKKTQYSTPSKVRDEGRIPAVLVNDDYKRSSSRSRQKKEDSSRDIFLSLDAKPIAAILKLIGKRDFISRVFDMNIYCDPNSEVLKESLQVLPRNLNYGPGKTNILNIQFIRANPDRTLKLGVPVEYLGIENCPGLRKGGTLMKLEKYILYNCKATEVPAKIVVDMTVLEIGDRVLVQDLEVDLDLLYSDRTMPVCEIVKDADTLKAKAKKLKREIFHKKKALREENATSPKKSIDPQSLEGENDMIGNGINAPNDKEDEGPRSGKKKPKPTYRRKKTSDARSRGDVSSRANSSKQGKPSKRRLPSSSPISNNLGEKSLKHE